MSDASGDPDLRELVAELTQRLEELESELEPERRQRPPTLSELSRFTSEVAIPGLILLLRTNIEALQLLRRTLRMADDRYDPDRGARVEDVRDRAEQLGQSTLSGLDDALDEIQAALEARPEDDDARELLDQVRSLNEDVRDRLEASGADNDVDTEGNGTAVDIDVEQELQTLKDDVEGQADAGDDGESSDGDG